jgi:hypothetical protein
MEETAEILTEMAQPIIIDLGKQKAAALKDLKQGEGKLWEEVINVVDEVKDMLGEEADGKVILPIIMIYQKKAKRRRLVREMFPYL